MKRATFIVFILIAGFQYSFATHYRAGEITFSQKGSLLYDATVVTYTTDINSPPDNDTVMVNWGDGTIGPAFRINGSGHGQSVGNGIKVNIYKPLAPHQYTSAAPYFIVSIADPNRIQNILNINGGSSVDIQFYIEDTIKVVSTSCANRYDNSPTLINPPIDYAMVGDTFVHNPLAYDPDGDSLSFQLIPCLQAQGSQVPLFVYPDQIQPGANNNLTINSRTGEIKWASPQLQGIYNIAILITEYRDGVVIGTEIRDMQIIVQASGNNTPPTIAAIHDTCIIAGDSISLMVSAVDTNTGQSITLTSDGGPFRDISTLGNHIAQYNSTTGVNLTTGTFGWQTGCNAIRTTPWEVLFKAQDNYPQGSLTDMVVWRIKVVAAAPQNLTSTAVTHGATLTWDTAANCTSSPNFIGYAVWRSSGTNPIPVDVCNPSLELQGYTLVADNVVGNTYTDLPASNGNYCYRVTAIFGNTAAGCPAINKTYSLPSNETCKNIIAGIEDVDGADGFVVYPNPATYKLYVHASMLGAYQVQLFDLLGQQLLQDNYSGDGMMDISSLSKGLYLARITQAGQSRTVKVTVQ